MGAGPDLRCSTLSLALEEAPCFPVLGEVALSLFSQCVRIVESLGNDSGGVMVVCSSGLHVLCGLGLGLHLSVCLVEGTTGAGSYYIIALMVSQTHLSVTFNIEMCRSSVKARNIGLICFIKLMTELYVYSMDTDMIAIIELPGLKWILMFLLSQLREIGFLFLDHLFHCFEEGGVVGEYYFLTSSTAPKCIITLIEPRINPAIADDLSYLKLRTCTEYCLSHFVLFSFPILSISSHLPSITAGL